MPKIVKSYLAIQGQEIERLREMVQQLFTELLAVDQELTPGPGQWLPPADLSESADMITVKVELPGVESADIRVSLLGNVLKITGQKREEQLSTRPVCYVCLERSYGTFTRLLNLYWAVNANEAVAWLADGVLTIRLPKLKESNEQEIFIPIKVPE